MVLRDGLLEKSDLASVIRCMLREAVEHVGYTPLALGNLRRELRVTEPRGELAHLLVTSRERGTRCCPLRLTFRMSNGPVLTLEWLRLAAGHSAVNNVRP